MKSLIFAVIAATLLIACGKKEILPADVPHVKSPYRVLLYKAGDTTISSTMWARVETVGLVTVEDSRFKAELINYNGSGVYTVRLTSKVNCQGIARWNWQGLTIDSVQPTDSTANTPKSDVLTANQVKTFTLTGDHKEGKIKVKLESECGNSSTLIIKITKDILPVKILENVGSYDEKTKKTTIAFTIDDPLLFDWILIQHNNGFEWGQVMLIGSDHSTKNYSFKL